jgi:uncharacterized protein YecE (DUF72 family)
MTAWAVQCRQIYCYFNNNDQDGYAVKNALVFKQLMKK